MGVTAKRTLVVAVGVFGMLLVAMSVAYACSANRHMDGSRSEGMPGTPVTVSNVQWVANDGTAFGVKEVPIGEHVEIRWAAKHTEGATRPHNVQERTQLLATAPLSEDGTFSATVAIPEGIPGGDYLLYAVGAEEYPVRDIATLPVRVLEGSQPQMVGSQPVADPAPGAPAPAAPAPGAPAPAAPAPADSAPVPAPAEGAPAPATSAPAPSAGAPAPAATAPVRELVNANVASQPEARVPAGLTRGSIDTASTDHVVPAALTNGYAAPTSEAPVQASSPVPIEAGTPSDSTAPTSGFASPERSGYEWAGVPESGSNSGLGAGFALLSGGMVLLLAGFTIATLSRRRERAKVTGR